MDQKIIGAGSLNPKFSLLAFKGVQYGLFEIQDTHLNFKGSNNRFGCDRPKFRISLSSISIERAAMQTLNKSKMTIT